MSPEAEIYNKFIREVKLRSILLSGIKFDRKDEYFDLVEDASDKLKNAIGYKTAFNPVETEDRGDDFTDDILALVDWSLDIKAGNKKLLSINVTYDILYSHVIDLEEEDGHVISRFAREVIRTTSFPYFREYVNRISNDSQLNIPPLPMFILPPVRENQAKGVDES